jgi:hypothetical protein
MAIENLKKVYDIYRAVLILNISFWLYIYIYIYIASEKQGWTATNSSIDDGHSTLVHSGYLLCS